MPTIVGYCEYNYTDRCCGTYHLGIPPTNTTIFALELDPNTTANGLQWFYAADFNTDVNYGAPFIYIQGMEHRIAAPTPKPRMNILRIYRDIADRDDLTLDQIEYIDTFDWDQFVRVGEARYNLDFGDWTTCDHYHLMFPGWMINDDILGRPRDTVSTLAIEDSGDYVWIEDCDQYARGGDDGDAWDYFQGTAYSDEWLCNNTFCCDNCGRRLDNDDYAGDGYCTDCYEDPEAEADLASYCANPLEQWSNPYLWRRIWRAKPGTALLYGLELETEAGSDLPQLAEELNELRHVYRFICKSDGSLSSGLELVTLPMDLDGHQHVFNWPNVTRTMRDNGAESKRNCGIHIHINKPALSELTLTKLTAFLCKGDHQTFNETLAQRKYYSNGYCNVANHVASDEHRVTQIKRNIKNAGRYVPVNANTGHHTVEIRIFAANLRPERILKNVEFVDALVHYCQQTSIQNLAPASFIAWVAAHRPDYRNLWNFMVEKNLADPAQFKKECHGHGAQLQRAA